MTTLYAMLNANAKAWWYYRELRQRGRAAEARKLERKSVLDTLRMLRAALDSGGYLSCGRGGFTLVYSANARLQGYDVDDMLATCKRVGLPTIDTRGLTWDAAWATISFPMIAVGRPADAAPWSSLSLAPLGDVLDMYRAIGATVTEGRS